MRFESRLNAPPERIWDWIITPAEFNAEMRPILRMTSPQDLEVLIEPDYQPGTRLFRSYLLLFGVLPVDRVELTITEIEPGRGFTEQSPMLAMRLWRHERRIERIADAPEASLLVDTLTFQPRFARPLLVWFIKQFFAHRHRVLRAKFSFP